MSRYRAIPPVFAIAFLATAWAGWNFAPIYVTDRAFGDKLAEVAKLPAGGDESARRVLVRVLDADDLKESLHADDGSVKVTVTRHRIRVEYDRTAVIVYGLRKTFHFVHDLELKPRAPAGTNTAS